MLIINNILWTKTLDIWGIQINALSYSDPRTKVDCFSKHLKSSAIQIQDTQGLETSEDQT